MVTFEKCRIRIRIKMSRIHNTAQNCINGSTRTELDITPNIPVWKAGPQRRTGRLTTRPLQHHTDVSATRLYVDLILLCRWFRFAQLAKGKKSRP